MRAELNGFLRPELAFLVQRAGTDGSEQGHWELCPELAGSAKVPARWLKELFEKEIYDADAWRKFHSRFRLSFSPSLIETLDRLAGIASEGT